MTETSNNSSPRGRDFRQLQVDIGRHLRDPGKFPAPEGLDNRRMQIYRDLLFNNVEGFITSGFPVLRKFYSEAGWLKLVRGFYREHEAHTPYFSEIGAEFVGYLSSRTQRRPEDPPFLAELAHYEYAETALFTAPDPVIPENVDANLDPIEHMPFLTPVAWVFSYRWPVYAISAGNSPWQMPERRTHLLLYRDRLDQVRFVLISGAIAELTQLIRGHESRPPVAGGAIVDELIGRQPAYAPFRDQAVAEIHKLRQQGVVIGAVKAAP